jgi:HK97 family phage major capsid protein
MTFTDVSTSNSDLLPIEWSAEVIKAMVHESAALGLSRRRTMSMRQTRMPAAAALAGAYWVGGSDSTDLKQTTKSEWAGVNLIVEELAALVAIPHAHRDDINFDVWEETKPQIVEAMGRKLDQAVFFGVDKPATWPTSIYDSILTAGQAVMEGTSGEDLAADIALSAQSLKARGHTTNGFAVEPGFQWGLVGMRSDDGVPIYQQNLSGPINTGLYGFPMMEVANGAWRDDLATVIHGDYSKSIVGIRQDITFTPHESGVISDADGAVVFNAMQQDSTVWRAVFRVAWARANPATRLGPNADEATGKFPWGAILPLES